MPTSLLRHSITETPEIEAAIDCALTGEPQASRADALRSLVLRGADATRHDRQVRQKLVEEWSGFMAGEYPPDAADALKAEWPQ